MRAKTGFEPVEIGSLSNAVGERLTVYFGSYASGVPGQVNPAIYVSVADPEHGFEEPYATFSVNLRESGQMLRPWMFFAKAFDENAGLAEQLRATRWFEPVKDVPQVRSGLRMYPPWTLKPEALPEHVRAAIVQVTGWKGSPRKSHESHESHESDDADGDVAVAVVERRPRLCS